MKAAASAQTIVSCPWLDERDRRSEARSRVGRLIWAGHDGRAALLTCTALEAVQADCVGYEQIHNKAERAAATRKLGAEHGERALAPSTSEVHVRADVLRNERSRDRGPAEHATSHHDAPRAAQGGEGLAPRALKAGDLVLAHAKPAAGDRSSHCGQYAAGERGRVDRAENDVRMRSRELEEE